jgi:hypothetical protein
LRLDGILGGGGKTVNEWGNEHTIEAKTSRRVFRMLLGLPENLRDDVGDGGG